MSLQAANPAINATVTASAGSGKTWMLVTRILRLLLDGADPGSILALTFTRKAAGEMQQRLAERLYQLATADEAELDSLLSELGIASDDLSRRQARRLYEAHQYCDYPVRTQTFHSFCQDVLARFPLEADVPPGFDLLESSSLLIQQARDALFNEAALNMHSPLANNLQDLMLACDGLFSLDKCLNSLLDHRSDWWAYTEQADNACEYASEKIKQDLEIKDGQDPVQLFFNHNNLEQIRVFAQLLAKTGTKTNLKHADTLANLLADEQYDATGFAIVSGCFLTQKNTAIVSGRKDSQSLRKKLPEQADEFLQLAEIIPARILQTRDQINRIDSYQLNRLWYFCGHAFIEHYQGLKQELRLLDFTDLEWRTYKLLQNSENAMWVQYKLDQRIDHFLIDEFQDTNPTQWQLILPLLQEMAASESDKSRSVFLVGDEKQSIYSFRRAKPELQSQASQWLADHLQAKAYPLNKSWRSSPAIIDAVNAIFEQETYQQRLPGFETHQTHQSTLPGQVTVLPLITQDKQADEDLLEAPEGVPEEAPEEAPDNRGTLRNPLQQARPQKDSIYGQEGQQIAQAIRQLIDEQVCINEADHARVINYDDIYILLRKRSHVADYEQALRQAGIPYLGANKGSLMECIEIQDMEALLDSLLTPFNNLALAQVLKSPLFAASDDDLMLIAKHKSSGLWYERIEDLHQQLPTDHPIHRAHVCIQRWRALTDRIPVHDLLDRIYSEADVLARYQSSMANSLKPRVQANLTRFMELALELDSGRYPSLMHFLQHLRSLKQLVKDAPDEAPMETTEARVKIMTIHASKGLEAPVVFLADCITPSKNRTSLSTLVDWPVEYPRPQALQLIPTGKKRDQLSEQRIEQQNQVQQREDAHLLYVAVTRAKQMLFVSACRPEIKPYIDWYTPIKQALHTLTGSDEDHLVYCQGTFPERPDQTKNQAVDQHSTENLAIDPRLQQKIPQLATPVRMIAPSKTHYDAGELSGDEDGQLRGIAIHRCLELLTAADSPPDDLIRQYLTAELSIDPQADELEDWLNEAKQLIQQTELQSIFQPPANSRAYNELPIHYRHQQQMVYGIIDRLVVSDDQVMIIDYKTHQQASPDNLPKLAAAYQQQMQLYAEGIRGAYPDKTIHAALLFTHCGCLHLMDIE